MEWRDVIDTRLAGAIADELQRRANAPAEPLPRGVTIALVGHRAAGKSTLLPRVAEAMGLPAVDLDRELEHRAGRTLRTWLGEDERSFREAERACFLSLPPGQVVACGGGFLAHHPEALVGAISVLVPISVETWTDRLKADTTRPRLLPELSLDDELRTLWAEREPLHRRARPLSWVDFLLRLKAGWRARRVVTAPADVRLTDFAWVARRTGAELLEVRTDLHAPGIELSRVARVLPVLVAERGRNAPEKWIVHGDVHDVELVETQQGATGAPGQTIREAAERLMASSKERQLRESRSGGEAPTPQQLQTPESTVLAGSAELPPAPAQHPSQPPGSKVLADTAKLPLGDVRPPDPSPTPPQSMRVAVEPPVQPRSQLKLLSFHAPEPMTPEAAERVWLSLPSGASLKHVEPLGNPAFGVRLLETQQRLIARFGEGRVTVLATGANALPMRALLARRNALDFLAADEGWAAAQGQRLLKDSVREAKAGLPGGLRLGIVGHAIAHSRSPRIHRQPFDRIELPTDADVRALVDALLPHYRGFAVTSPFKGAVIPGRVVNTLYRGENDTTFQSANTDVDGALAVLSALKSSEVTVLGKGGATAALAEAAVRLSVQLKVQKREQLDGAALSGTVVWTWPASVEAPEALRFEPGTKVVLIAYGAPARELEKTVRAKGGVPVKLGARWFIAQARAQRALFEGAA